MPLGSYSNTMAGDRQRVSDELCKYIGFADWFGKGFSGFEPFEPRFALKKECYSIQFVSEPPGAAATIDGEMQVTLQQEIVREVQASPRGRRAGWRSRPSWTARRRSCTPPSPSGRGDLPGGGAGEGRHGHPHGTERGRATRNLHGLLYTYNSLFLTYVQLGVGLRL